MPPSLRRRGQPHHMSPGSEADDTDNDMDLGARQDEHDMDGEDDALGGFEDEDEEGEGEDDGDLEEDEEALVSPSQGASLPNLDPPPPYLREISTLASWTVSSSKPGCSIPQLRHANTNLFWQSDGPQPHYLNIHFFKLVRIVGLRLYLDFEQDESYTPTRIIFLAGSGMNDLQEWGEMRLENPRGWVWADFSGVGDVDSEGDDDEDEDDGDQGAAHHTHSQRVPMETSPLANGTARARHDASSDSENAAPSHLHTPMASQTPLPTSSFTNHYHAQHYHSPPSLHPTSTPSLPRPSSHYPRAPFTSLTPSHPTTPFGRRPAPPRRPRAPKMPTLRAHLLQIKILENHQNGKDTHLRGLQVFARSDDDARGPPAAVGAASAQGEARIKTKKKKAGGERFELGTALAWDAYGGDVR